MFPTQASFLTDRDTIHLNPPSDVQDPLQRQHRVARAANDPSYFSLEDEPDCLPGSYKWLKMTTGVSWDDDVEPESFKNSSCRDTPTPTTAQVDAGRVPAQADSIPYQPAEDGWLRANNGVLQRQVMLQNLSQATQYNGCVGWAEVSQLESAANQPPRLLRVQLTSPARQVQVSSAHVFVVGPLCRPHKPRDSLFTVGVKLQTPRGPVSVNALVDTGCELQGIVNKHFAAAWDLPLSPAAQSVRTATGEVVTGLQQAAVQTHFAPDFTRRVEYGVLDIPGFDVVLGMGFLRQCAPYQLQEDACGRRSVRLTSPSSHRVVQLEAQTRQSISVPDSPPLTATVQSELPIDAAVSFEMQWSVPSAADYDNTMAAFSVVLDPQTNQPVLRWTTEEQDPLEPGWDRGWSDKLELSELEEGVVFRLGADAAEHLHHVPAPVRSQFEALLQQYREAVFPDREFPPFPPARDVTFRIQLQDGAQIPASPVHKLSPALVEQLRTMIQELLHDGLIVPSTSPFAAPLLMVKKP